MANSTKRYNELPVSVQIDIAENLIDKIPYLQDQKWNPHDLRYLLNDLVDQLKVQCFSFSVEKLHKQLINVWEQLSNIVVKRLEDSLNRWGDLDPILVCGEKFIDGRHRVKAYFQSKRQTIPVIDIKALLSLDWKEFMENENEKEID